MSKRWSLDGMLTRRATRSDLEPSSSLCQEPAPDIKIAVMGITGTGKSSFIQLLTGNKSIEIGHGQDSKTADVQTVCYVDTTHGHSVTVTLIDTPGFDDSRAVPDGEILQRILDFLKPETGEPQKLNGLVYMHNISLPRFADVQKKNLRVFHSLCGDDNLKNVRIVTTNWDRVTKSEGKKREKELETKQFKVLVDAGASMHRHRFKDKRSSRKIISGFFSLDSVTMQIQQELEDPKKKLKDTSAGAVLVETMGEMQKKYEKERMELQRQLDEAKAGLARQDELAAELEELKTWMKVAEEDRKRLAMTLDDLRTMLKMQKTQKTPEMEITQS